MPRKVVSTYRQKKRKSHPHSKNASVGKKGYKKKIQRTRKMKKTPSRTSPTGKKRGCLCKNGTYSSKCCDGSLQAQGIGALTGQGTTP